MDIETAIETALIAIMEEVEQPWGKAETDSIEDVLRSLAIWVRDEERAKNPTRREMDIEDALKEVADALSHSPNEFENVLLPAIMRELAASIRDEERAKVKKLRKALATCLERPVLTSSFADAMRWDQVVQQAQAALKETE